MADVTDFLRENVGSANQEEEIKFKRFKTPFKIKGLSGEDVTEIRSLATKRVLNKKTHQYEQQTDQNKFASEVIVASVVSPDLRNAELQKSWGALGEPEKVLGRMLTAGEYNQLSEKVMDLSGLTESFEDDIEEAKN